MSCNSTNKCGKPNCGCSSSHTCNCGSCNSCNNNSSCCDPCNEQPCGCAVELDMACIRYSGSNLDCVGLTTGETLEQLVVSLDNKMCDLSSGVDGENGDSAYQIWLNLGNIGTEQDFIDSLGGTPGPIGPAGPAGPTGPTGPASSNIVINGDDDIVVTTDNSIPGTTTFTIGRPKEFFYDDHVQTLDIETDSAFIDNTYFFPTPYSGLTYTNTSGDTKNYLVTVSYDTFSAVSGLLNAASIGSWVDGAIIKTVGSSDTILYESLGTSILQISLYDGPNITNVINLSSLDTVETVDGDAVYAAFGSSRIPRNISFVYPVTLNNTEKVSLKFKGKSGNRAWLSKAQILVQEI